jgi:hypothetical protein
MRRESMRDHTVTAAILAVVVQTHNGSTGTGYRTVAHNRVSMIISQPKAAMIAGNRTAY